MAVRWQPKIGGIVTTETHPGQWTVWSQGPERSEWWLMPYDKTAHTWVTDHPDSTTNSCVLVKRTHLQQHRRF